MAERKVINKYFPPDFDPNKVPFGRVSGGGQHKVRLMAPFSMRCATCGNYIYKGTKFNARKEIVWGEEYLGIVTYRFYIRCPMCASELTFKTDPKNSDYVSEHGVTRNFEAWREEKIANEELTYRKRKEEEMDPMKALENITTDSKRNIEILEMLDEVRTKNARYEKVDADVALEILAEKEQAAFDKLEQEQKRIEEEDQRLAEMVFKNRKQIPSNDKPKSMATKREAHEAKSSNEREKKILKKESLIVKKKTDKPAAKPTTSKPRSLVTNYSSDSD